MSWWLCHVLMAVSVDVQCLCCGCGVSVVGSVMAVLTPPLVFSVSLIDVPRDTSKL